MPAATQWGVAKKAALGLRPVYDEFIRQAALGEVIHNDDTGMRILRLARESADPRTGVFTSGIVSLGPGWKVALYFSGAEHAGENLAEVQKRRPAGLAPLIQMCDALSWNTSSQSEGVKRLHGSLRGAWKTEPNSGLGNAIRYMLPHWMPLTLFLREPWALIDDNIVVRILKKAILHRKNSNDLPLGNMIDLAGRKRIDYDTTPEMAPKQALPETQS